MSYITERYEKAAIGLAENLNSRGFEAYCCKNAEDALAKALELIPLDHVVSFGGSASVDAVGIKEALYERGQTLIDRSKAQSREEALEMQRKALLCDTYLMSTNALSREGILVNVDGNGNRVASLCYGPRQVIMVVGMNKLCPDVGTAVSRARNVAAPINAQRFPISTPCKSSGNCADCKSADTICSQIVITRFCREKGRIKILLVPEELGF